MSARSMVRASQRHSERRAKRLGKRARAGAGIVAIAGATALSGGVADAATFTVTNDADSGAGSLRQAITSANAAADADTVTFAPGITGAILLTSGEINITAPVTIQGPGADDLAIDGDDNDRVFEIDGSGVSGTRIPVTISGLTLRGGDGGSGGAVYGQYTDFTLASSVVSGNYASSEGGGLYLDSAVVTITDSEISGNRSSGGGGAMYVDGDNDPATPATDTVTITDSVVRGNRAGGNAGALYVDDSTGGAVVIARNTIAGNFADGTGGGILFYGHHGPSTISQSTISGNTADGDGGGFYFDSDYATDPGALTVENSTVAGNRSTDEGGGAYIANSDNESVRFINSTVAGNSAENDGGGIFRDDFAVTLSSTIVADNRSTATTQADLGQDGAATGSFTAGNSLLETSAGVTLVESPAGSNVLGADPQLGSLAANGGPTRTELPAASSPVIDKGVANGLATDQRGLPRTSGAGTDIGSVELTAPPTPDTTVDGAFVKVQKKQKQRGGKVFVKIKAGADEPVQIVASGSIKLGKKKIALKKQTKRAPATNRIRFKLKPKQKSANKQLFRAFKNGKRAKASLSVKLTDDAGNSITKKPKATLTGPRPKKKNS